MSLSQVKVERLYRQISHQLIDAIRRGDFTPGGALPAERELAKQLGVSRSSIREALIALEVTGWVEIRTGNGVFVANPLPQDMVTSGDDEFSLHDLLKARQAFEGMTAELAARHGNPQQRAALLALTESLLQLQHNDAQFLQQDKAFHLLISAMSGNDLLRDMMEYLWNKRHSARFIRLEQHYANVDFAREMNQDHQRIAQAIVDGDALQARASMEQHLQHVCDRLFAL